MRPQAETVCQFRFHLSANNVSIDEFRYELAVYCLILLSNTVIFNLFYGLMKEIPYLFRLQTSIT